MASNRFYEFQQSINGFDCDNTYLPYKQKNGRIENDYGDKNIFQLNINPDVLELLANTKLPKKFKSLELPYDNLYISNHIKLGNLELPNGLFITKNYDYLEKEDIGWLPYYFAFTYEFRGKKREFGASVFQMWDVIDPKNEIIEFKIYNKSLEEIDDLNDYSYYVWEQAGNRKPNIHSQLKNNEAKNIIKLVYKLLLFLNCPDVEIRHTDGRPKSYRKNRYDFFYPKKLYTELSHDLRKYIQKIKNTHGVMFNYNYKYIVRGHFRDLNSPRYKNKKTLWIKPFYKGNGDYVEKESIAVRNT